MQKLFGAAAFGLATLIAANAFAHDFKLGDLMVDHPWARASIGQAKAGAAYLTIVNGGSEADRLIAAATPAAKRTELHTHIMKDGVMKMREVEAVEVAPGEPTVLQPGGLHVMLMGLKAPLSEGETFPLTLTFEKAGSLEVTVKIESAKSMEPSMKHEHKHGS